MLPVTNMYRIKPLSSFLFSSGGHGGFKVRTHVLIGSCSTNLKGVVLWNEAFPEEGGLGGRRRVI